nr:MATE family efflux transporter [Paenibacillus assamensis]
MRKVQHMIQTYSRKQKIKQLLAILLPILVTQVTMQLMGFFDTIMSGQFSTEHLAGVAMAVSIWVPVYTGLSGIFLAVTPIIAQHVGAGRKDKIASSLIQAAYLSIIVGIAVIVIGAFVLDPIFNWMTLEPEVARVAREYLSALGIGVIPLFLYTVLRASIDGLGQTRITMFITLLSFPINVFLNYCFIFGKFGMPRLGGVGAGVATAITYIVIFIIAVILMKRNEMMRSLGMLGRFEAISFAHWKEVLTIGVPIGLSIFFEVSVFSAVTLLMSNYDTVTIASHQSALSFASLLYMLPLSIAMSMTIVIGFEVGAKRIQDAKQYARIGILSAVSLSVFCAVFLFLFNENISRLYSNDPQVVALTQVFMVYAIFFQLSDAVAAPVQGILRGYKDVKSVFIIAFCSYWIVGLPVGYVLAQTTSLEAYGYWVGLIAGLAIGAVALFLRMAHIERKAQQGELAI